MKKMKGNVLKPYEEPRVVQVNVLAECGFAGTLRDPDDPIDTDPEEDI